MDRSGAGAVISQKYRLERKLGQGGMGEVWVARHLQLDADVALKLLVSEHAQTAGARARFEREAKAAAQVKSPHIVHVFDYGVDDDTPYLAMELLEGEDLEARLRRVGRLPLDAAAGLVGPACKALRRIHDAGLVHRDLKPSNVFLARHDDEDHVKILDFGIAKTTALARTGDTTSGVVVGSPPYMSPEQVLARKELDHRTDLWSLGVILFRALTGKLPFDADVVTKLLVEICTAPPPRASRIAPDLGAGLDDFFERALAKDPGDRFQTAAEMGEAFAALCRASVAPPHLVVPVGEPGSGTEAAAVTAVMTPLSPDSTLPSREPPEPAPAPAPEGQRPRRRESSVLPAAVIGALLAGLVLAAVTTLAPSPGQATSDPAGRPEVASGPQVTASAATPPGAVSGSSGPAPAAASTSPRPPTASAGPTVSGSPPPQTSGPPTSRGTPGAQGSPPDSMPPPGPPASPVPAASPLAPTPAEPPPPAPKREFW